MTAVSAVQVLIADALDLMIGDLRRLPHPAKMLGKAIIVCDRILRRFRSTPAAERVLV